MCRGSDRSDGRRARQTASGPSDRCDRVAERTRDLPPRLDLQPGEDLLGVIAGGESADAEPPSDLRIRAPVGNQQRDLRLSQGQPASAHELLRSEQRGVRLRSRNRRGRRWLDRRRGPLPNDAPPHRVHPRHQLQRAKRLRDVVARSAPEPLDLVRVGVARGQNEDGAPVLGLSSACKPPCRFSSAWAITLRISLCIRSILSNCLWMLASLTWSSGREQET